MFQLIAQHRGKRLDFITFDHVDELWDRLILPFEFVCRAPHPHITLPAEIRAIHTPLARTRTGSLPSSRPHPPASSTFFSQVHSVLFCLGSTRSPAITTRRGSNDERSRGGGYLPIYVVDRPLRVAAGEVGDDFRFVLNYPSSSRASHRAGGFVT